MIEEVLKSEGGNGNVIYGKPELLRNRQDSRFHKQSVFIEKSTNKFDAGLPFYLSVLLLLLPTLVFMMAPNQVFAGQPQFDTHCAECHKDIINRGLGKLYVHRPFMELQCEVCHVDDRKDMPARNNTKAFETKNIQEKTIKWFEFTSSPTTENWFFVPSELYGTADLVVSAKNTLGKVYKEVVELPVLETLPQKIADSSPPLIQKAGVRGVYRGVLISARIGWTTDRKTESEVKYGIESLDYSVKKEGFTTEHEMVLQSLRADQVYQYVVISRDIFGNSAVSETGSFSTRKLTPQPHRQYEKPEKTDIVLKTEFYQYNEDYLLKLTTNKPVMLKLGRVASLKGINRVDENKFKTVNTATVNNISHTYLRSIDAIASAVCRKCHAGMFTTGNHAINRGPSAGMFFPADYSTNSAGHMTCTTCHDPHSSDFEYLTVKPRGRELCVGCHRGYDLTPDKRHNIMLMAEQKEKRPVKENDSVGFIAQK